jgi:RAB protein geranylgeranyltransferase component A
VDVNIEVSRGQSKKGNFLHDVVPGIMIANKELVLTCEFLSTNIEWFEDFLTLNKYFTFQQCTLMEIIIE